MSIQKELEDLIKNEVLIEIEDYIDELFEIIASKKEDENTKEENRYYKYDFFLDNCTTRLRDIIESDNGR